MIYLVARTDDWCYDETDSVVVEAGSPDHAREVAKGARGDQDKSVWDTAEVQTIGTNHKALLVRGVILHTSYNAG